jgi:OOP family OmpA-OmpF porin
MMRQRMTGRRRLLASDDRDVSGLGGCARWVHIRPGNSARWRGATHLALAVAAVLIAILLGTADDAAAKDVAAGGDYPGIPRFSGSSLIGNQTLAFDAFTLPTGPARQDDQFQWQLSQKLDVEGKVSGYVYDVPAGRTPVEVFRNYQAALANLGFATLFECAGDETCGRADWLSQQIYAGNHVMQNGGLRSSQAIVYGGDIHYLAAKRSQDGRDTYASLLVAQEENMSAEAKDTVSVVLHLIEPKPIGQSMVMVDAAKMDSDISANGHVSLYGIYFETDSATVKPESEPTLGEIAKLLKTTADLQLYVVGHTDSVGGYDHNMQLSTRRAKAVVDALTGRFGIKPQRLHAAGVGFLSPVAPNTTEDGRAKNRRVELVRG